jgi:hypothetical protein
LDREERDKRVPIAGQASALLLTAALLCSFLAFASGSFSNGRLSSVGWKKKRRLKYETNRIGF